MHLKYTAVDIQLVANDNAVYDFSLGNIRSVCFFYTADLYHVLFTDGASNIVVSAENNRILVTQKGTSTRTVKVKVLYE